MSSPPKKGNPPLSPFAAKRKSSMSGSSLPSRKEAPKGSRLSSLVARTTAHLAVAGKQEATLDAERRGAALEALVSEKCRPTHTTYAC